MSELQIVIECFIQQNGGRDMLANIIDSEWCKYFYPKKIRWTEREKLFILTNYNTMTCNAISIRIGRTFEATRHQIAILRADAILNYRKTKVI